MKQKKWGQLLSVDLAECRPSLINNRKKLVEFCEELCEEIDMVAFGKPIIKRFGKGDLEGYSMIQFIMTSSITAHMDEIGNRAFIDIFSCKPFDTKKAGNFCKRFFRAGKMKAKNLYRE